MPPAGAKASFPNAARIKSSLQIQQIVKGRNSVYVYPLKCYFQVREAMTQRVSRLAVVVPKKRFRKAVDRNRLKRLMREAYRTHRQMLFSEDDHVVDMCWVYVATETVTYQEMCHAVETIQHKIQAKLCEKC